MLSTVHSSISALLLAFVLGCGLSFGSAKAWGQSSPNLYDLKLEYLDSFSSLRTKTLSGKQSLWILFQPDCASCKTQLNDLQCLNADIVQIAVGFGGNQERLNKELLPSKFDGQRVLASPQLRRVLNTTATPSLFVVNQSGQIVKRIQGAAPCESLKAQIADLR